MLSNKLNNLIPSTAKSKDKQKYMSLIKDFGFDALPFNNPRGVKLNGRIKDFCDSVEQLSFSNADLLMQVEQTLFDFENNSPFYSKVFEFKADKDAKELSKIKVVGLPKTLEDLQVLYEDEVILNFVVKQVIAHSCFSACRKAEKDGQPLKEWQFKLPTERQSAESKKDKKLLSSLKSLGLSYEDMLKIIDNMKLQQSQDLMK